MSFFNIFTWLCLVVELVVLIAYAGYKISKFLNRNKNKENPSIVSRVEEINSMLDSIQRDIIGIHVIFLRRAAFEKRIKDEIPKILDMNYDFIFKNKRHMLIEKSIFQPNKTRDNIMETYQSTNYINQWLKAYYEKAEEINSKEFKGENYVNKKISAHDIIFNPEKICFNS